MKEQHRATTKPLVKICTREGKAVPVSDKILNIFSDVEERHITHCHLNNG